LPESVLSIQNDSIVGCIFLERITVDARNTMYKSVDGVLFDKNQTVLINYPSSKAGYKYDVPDTVTSIGSMSFWGNNRIRFLSLPESLTSIGSSAFAFCGELQLLSIPRTVHFIGDQAFESCRALSSVTYWGKHDPGDDSQLVFNNCPNLTVVTVSDGYFPNIFCGKPIERPFAAGSCGINLSWVYYKNTSTLSITGLGEMYEYDSIYDIPWYAYRSSIVAVGIGSNVTKISKYTFSESHKLGSIHVDEGNKYYKSVNGILFDTENKTLVRYPPKKDELAYDIPPLVVSIGQGAFSHCKSLIFITIPESVANISEKAFYECSAMMSLEIPASVTLIQDNAFSHCHNLSDVWYFGENDPGRQSREVFDDCPYLFYVKTTRAFTDEEMCGKKVIVDSSSSSLEDSSSDQSHSSSNTTGDSSSECGSMKSSSDVLNSEQSAMSSSSSTSVGPNSVVGTSSYSSPSGTNSESEEPQYSSLASSIPESEELKSQESSWADPSSISSPSQVSQSEATSTDNSSLDSEDHHSFSSQRQSSTELDSAISSSNEGKPFFVVNAGLHNQPGVGFTISLAFVALMQCAGRA
jgi:hypothetical protein